MCLEKINCRIGTNDCYKVFPVTCCSALMDKMQRIPTYKLNKLTLDPAYTSVRAVCWNVFHTACLMACCFKAMVDTIGSDLFDKEELINCIRRSSASVASKTFRIRKQNSKYLTRRTLLVITDLVNSVPTLKLVRNNSFRRMLVIISSECKYYIELQ